MHIREQILYLLLIQSLSEPRHLAPAESNDFADALVVGGNTALRKKRLLENSFESWPLFPAGRVRFVALIAVPVINTSSCDLLFIQSQFSVGLAQFSVTTR